MLITLCPSLWLSKTITEPSIGTIGYTDWITDGDIYGALFGGGRQ